MDTRIHPSSWEHDSDDTLYSVTEFDRTPLARLCRGARYRLIASGALPTVRVGRHIFVRRGAIRAFMAAAEQRVLSPKK